MSPSDLRKAAAESIVTARVISDGCRDYFVEINRKNGAGFLRDRGNDPMRFKSLREVHDLLSQCQVQEVLLASRVADDEAASPAGACRGFHEMRLSHPTRSTNTEQGIHT